MREEFKKLMEELALGSQVEPALHNLGRRVPLIDLKFFIPASSSSGRRAPTWWRCSGPGVAGARAPQHGRQAESAYGAAALLAGLLCLMPIVVGLGFWVLKPEYIRLLYTDPVGSKFLTYAIISEIVGILVIRRIANIRV